MNPIKLNTTFDEKKHMHMAVRTGPIKVLMSSTSYPADLKDWKGLFIRHLTDALARRADIALHLWAPPGEVAPSIVYAPTEKESAFLRSLMRDGGIAHLLRSRPLKAMMSVPRLLKGLNSAYSRSAHLDIYHVNWLQNALAIPQNSKPLVISVLGTDMQLLKLPFMRTLIRRTCRQHPTYICPNAEWMVEPLQRAFGDVCKIKPMLFGIDPVWYAINRRVPANGHRWLVVTRITRAKLGPLLEWGAPLFENSNERQLHLFGPMQEKIELPDWIHYHGPASPETLSTDWFPEATGLLTLSRHAEGRPQVMLEAMAAGLPIVASRLPAHENIICPSKAGSLCDSALGLEKSIRSLENVEENYRTGVKSREWVLKEVGTWDDSASRFQELYEHLMASEHE